MTTAIDGGRPGARSMLTLVGCEAKMVVRDTAGLVVPIGLPLLILLTSASGAGDDVIVNGRTALDLYVLPLLLAMVMGAIGIINMPSFLAYYRRSGILRRLGVTPASPLMVLFAQAVVSLVQAAVGIALALFVAVVFFDARPPVDVGAALGVLALAMAAMYGTGMIVAALAPTPNSAVAIGLVGFLGIGAIGGMFGGREALPPALAEVGGWLPVGATVDALGAAWAGTAVDAPPLIGLAAAILVGTVTAVAFFRWE
ncbi:ABC transporter permease [Actinocorallia populi]|uniref:ABC transporter permease n=1 Tax=Actinocorallia populi TaxID=2079200 RepID=UPI000D088271|nr:ABC transporter permease [Actinocorallia populi]